MKKIAVCGKGGSGKSVTVALLANRLQARHKRVLVVDGDESNTGLHRLLGFERPPEPLLNLLGGKQKIEDDLITRIKAGESELTVQLIQKEMAVRDIPAEYLVTRDNITLVSVGKVLMALEGCACPMGIVTRSFLKKLRLEPDEIAVVDLEAGVEHFGRGVETSMDGVLVIVEPSLDSLEVAERVHALSAALNIGDVWAVLNKIQSDEVAAMLRQKLDAKGIPVAGLVHYDPQVFQACLEGRLVQGSLADSDIDRVLDFIFP